MVKIFAALILLATALEGYADVDLDRELPQQSHSSRLPNGMGLLRLPVDLEPGFPEISNQNPLGACQSFAMAAWLDYIFYFKTGHVVELSEKHLAYQLLSFMADEFWDPASQSYPKTYLGESHILPRPYLGSGIAPFMLASYFNTGAVPNDIYEFGAMSATEGNIGLDSDIYNKYFEAESNPASRDEYLAQLPVAFLSAPPERFIYRLTSSNFSDGNSETVNLKTAEEISDLVGLNNENTVTYYNGEFQGFQEPASAEEWRKSISYFARVSDKFGQRNHTVGKQETVTLLKKSLDKRMAVMIAANVWIGDWVSGVIFKGGGGHAMVVVGYQERDGKIFFKVRNSWGKDRLVKGYDYISGDVLSANLIYFVVHEP